MQKMIAYCGLECTECPTFIATQNDDDLAREKTAEMLAEKYNIILKPEEINCDGCRSSGDKLIGYCNICEIRKCAMKKFVENCCVCEEQPCDKLKRFHQFSSDAKTAYETLVRNRSQPVISSKL